MAFYPFLKALKKKALKQMWKSVKTLDDADGHIEIYFLNFCVLKEYKKWEVNMKSLKRNMA